jgi:hypothetical protein
MVITVNFKVSPFAMIIASAISTPMRVCAERKNGAKVNDISIAD